MSLCDALGGDKSSVTTIAIVITLDTNRSRYLSHLAQACPR
jgi:hypothetical protein